MPLRDATPSPGADHRADLELVENILEGSEVAWHAFVDRYAGLISHIARRYLSDEDEVGNVQVKVLASLHGGKLATYRGRSSLATWLILVSRNATADLLRHLHGRREIPHGLKQLDDLHREIFRLYYVEGTTFTGTLEELSKQGHELDVDQLLEALHTIDARITERTHKRITYDLASHSIAGASGRILEYCDHVRAESAASGNEQDPLEKMVAHEAEQRAREALRLIDELPPEEQRILAFRFEKGMRAKEIASEMGLPSQRKVFTVLDRVVRNLRRLNNQKTKSLADRAENAN